VKIISEPISHPRHAFRFLRFEIPAFRGEPHRHRHLELTWIESGDGLRFVGDRVEPFEPGDLVLVGSETPHCWISSPGSGTSIATVAQFAPDFLHQPGFPELASIAPLAERAAFGLAIRGDVHARATELLRRMRVSSDLGRLAGLVAMLDLLIAQEHDLHAIAHSPMRAPHGRGSAPPPRRVDRVIGWIHRELGHELTVADAARIARISAGSFSRYFHKAVGRTFTQYVNDVRCSEASVRLRRSDKSVAMIAAECGFETMSHFNRQFRLRMGATPRAYRRGHPPSTDHGNAVR
jgi:AraC-like DNA-binding protein